MYWQLYIHTAMVQYRCGLEPWFHLLHNIEVKAAKELLVVFCLEEFLIRWLIAVGL